MRRSAGWLFCLVLPAAAEAAAPIFVFGRPPETPPAVSGDGQRLVFGSAVTQAGKVTTTADLYVDFVLPSVDQVRKLTDFSGEFAAGVTAVALTRDGRAAAYTAIPGAEGSVEEVHWIETETGKDRILVADKEGCIQPLAIDCPNCFFPCLHQPHVSPDGAKVLYAASRERPFYVVNTDGSGLTRLPVYSGWLADAPQRVISDNGLVVFASQAPSGPTFAASATDVYVMNLNGTGLRNLTRFGNDPAVFSWNATISADGRLVVFESNYDTSRRGAGKVNQILAVNTNGTGLRALTAGTDASTSPSLTADGSRVVFLQGGQIQMMNTSGRGPVVPLTSLRQSAARDPVISDDGSTVAFTIGPASGGRGAVYRVPTAGGDIRPVHAPRAVNPGGVVSLSSYAPPSAGSLVNVYGMNFGGDSLLTASGLPWPKTLGGIALLVNGEPAPLLAVTPWQLVAHLAQTTPEGAATFEVRGSDGRASAPVTVELKALAPEVFAYPVSAVDPVFGYAQAAAFHAGTAVAADQAHPAQAGETLEIYGSGLGRTEPVVPAGEASPFSPPARAVVTPRVLIGDREARVTFAGLVPGLAGIYQVNAAVPEGLEPGLHGLMWAAGEGGFVTGFIAVK